MPTQFDQLLADTSGCEAFTDDEVADLRQEITRDVVTELMFGPQQPDRERDHVSKVDRADITLRALSSRLLDTADARSHLDAFVDDPTDVRGAMYFACLLSLVQEQEPAIWWWQFAAGAGDLTAAYCLSLLYRSRGEMRDAEHWMRQFLAPDTRTAFIPPPSPSQALPDAQLRLFREAVRRLAVVEVDGIQLYQPDRRFFEQIAVHLPPPDARKPDAAVPRCSPLLLPGSGVVPAAWSPVSQGYVPGRLREYVIGRRVYVTEIR